MKKFCLKAGVKNAHALVIVILFAMASATFAANVSFSFTNSLGSPDTNYFKVIQVDANPILSDGSAKTIGVPARLTPAADGKITNAFEQGTYLVTNGFLNRGFLIRVPNDHGATVYCGTCGPNNNPTNLAFSGYNTYVTISYGTNPAPTFDQVTNALGFLPVTGPAATNSDLTTSNALRSLILTFQIGSTALTNFNSLGTNFFYPRSNPSNFVTATVTNGLVTQAITNTIYQLLTTFQIGSTALTNFSSLGTNYFYPRSNPSNFVTATVTNGLSTILFAQTLSTNATNFAQNIIGAALTNYARDVIGLALTNYTATLSTNGTNFAKGIGTSLTNFIGTLSTNATNWALTLSTNDTNFAKAIGLSTTNFIISTSNALQTTISSTTTGVLKNNGVATNTSLYGSPTLFGTLALQSTNTILMANNSGLLGFVAVTPTELTNVAGTTGGIQTNINARVRTVDGTVTNTFTLKGTATITTNAIIASNLFVGGWITATNLTANKALISGAAQQITNSTTTATELGYVSGVTSALQTQLNARTGNNNGVATNLTTHGTITATDGITLANFAHGNRVLIDDGAGVVSDGSATAAEVGYLSGATGGIQTNIDARIATVNGIATNSLTIKGNLNVNTNAFLNSAIVTNLFTNSVLTASRAVFTDPNKAFGSSAASSVLLNSLTDADGSGVSVFSSGATVTNYIFRRADSATLSIGAATFRADNGPAIELTNSLLAADLRRTEITIVSGGGFAVNFITDDANSRQPALTIARTVGATVGTTTLGGNLIVAGLSSGINLLGTDNNSQIVATNLNATFTQTNSGAINTVYTNNSARLLSVVASVQIMGAAAPYEGLVQIMSDAGGAPVTAIATGKAGNVSTAGTNTVCLSGWIRPHASYKILVTTNSGAPTFSFPNPIQETLLP